MEYIKYTESLLLWKIHSSSYIVDYINSADGFEGEEKTFDRPFWLLPPLEKEESSGVGGPALQQLNVLIQSQLPSQVTPVLEWGGRRSGGSEH